MFQRETDLGVKGNILTKGGWQLLIIIHLLISANQNHDVEFFTKVYVKGIPSVLTLLDTNEELSLM